MRKKLSYYEEMMGSGFRADAGSIASALKKWLPRMADTPRRNVSAALAEILEQMKRRGKKRKYAAKRIHKIHVLALLPL